MHFLQISHLWPLEQRTNDHIPAYQERSGILKLTQQNGGHDFIRNSAGGTGDWVTFPYRMHTLLAPIVYLPYAYSLLAPTLYLSFLFLYFFTEQWQQSQGMGHHTQSLTWLLRPSDQKLTCSAPW